MTEINMAKEQRAAKRSRKSARKTARRPAKRPVRRVKPRRGAVRTLAAAPSLDQNTCAGHVFAETSVLSNNAAQLADARRFIAGAAYKRNGSGMAPPKIPSDDELGNPNTKAIWERCQKAAKDAASDDVKTCKHFVIWYSDDNGKTPSKKPSRIPDDWPYDQTDKIKGSWGPFNSPIKPAGDNIYVMKYCGVP
jgi:hypothetical protein